MASAAMRTSLLRQPLTSRFLATTNSSTPAFRQHLTRQPILAAQRAAFQTSQRRNILPPLPQEIKGSVNEPARVPEPDPKHGSYHWSVERAVSAAVLPLTVAPFAAGSLNPLLDGLFIGLILVHSHMGFQSCITDYFPAWRVPRVRKMLNYILNACFFLVGWGWYEFETNDVGLTEGVRRIWKA